MKMDSMTEEKMVLMTKFLLKEAFNTQKTGQWKLTSMKLTKLESEKKFTDELFAKLFDKFMTPFVNEQEQGKTDYLIEFLVRIFNFPF